MSDVTDINALIERLEAMAPASGRTIVCDDRTTGEMNADIRAAAAALRTLAKRQPVGDTAITGADIEAAEEHYPPRLWRNEAIIDLAKCLSRHRQAAEQRGADRAFEEAAGIAEAYEPGRYNHPGTVKKYIAAAIRQRIGEK